MGSVQSLSAIPRDVRLALVRELGYDTDGEFVLRPGGSDRHRDPYTGEPVRVDNMAILQGSTLILDDNPVSLDWYMDEYPGRL